MPDSVFWLYDDKIDWYDSCSYEVYFLVLRGRQKENLINVGKKIEGNLGEYTLNRMTGNGLSKQCMWKVDISTQPMRKTNLEGQ